MEEKWDDLYFNNDLLHFHDAVRVNGTYKCTGNNIIIRGMIGTKITLKCYRCLESYEVSFNLCFDEEFSSESIIDHDDRYTFLNSTIDLNKMVEDTILLAMPMKSICREECKGLCVKCGNNLNLNDCSYCIDANDN